MGFGIYTGGTTGLTDGTLVSASNKLTFPSITTVLDAHIRCGEDEYSAQIDFDDIPLELEISFNAGGVWYGIGEAPFYAATSQGPGNSDVWDVNYPIKLRQVAVPVTADDTFTTDGTVSACTALSTPTLTATPGDTLIDLSWTNVANEDGYTLDRSTAVDFSANLVSVSKGAGVTTHTATGLTNGVTYYFRVKAEGSGRYSDSGYGTDDATPYTLTTATFSPSLDGNTVGYHATNSWATVRAMSPGYSAVSNASDNLPAGFSRGGSADCAVHRVHLHFNTSSLPDGATVVAARLKVWGHETYTKSTYHSSTSVVLLESLTTAGASLTTSNFPYSGNLGSTELASRKAHADWTDGAYNTFALNASGLALVNKTGTTRLAFVEASDFDNSDPGAGTARALQFYPQESAFSTKRPVLEVDYT